MFSWNENKYIKSDSYNIVEGVIFHDFADHGLYMIIGKHMKQLCLSFLSLYFITSSALFTAKVE